VVLNWNGWRDTIECLESLFRLDYPSYSVVVCDNASSDGSLEQIRRWANGQVTSPCADINFAHLTTPPVAKPIPLIWYTSPEASLTGSDSSVDSVVIETGDNLGFAGGCNVGLRYALARTACEYVWLLNNDTVVERNSLTKLVEKMSTEPRLGICGSVLLDYALPRTVQALGGRRYSAWRGRVLPDTRSELTDAHFPSQRIDYVHGASMLVRREFLLNVGLMEEGYFLYFEELDWAMRASGRFQLGYAPDSFVYHKEGASIGTSSRRMARSLLSERYAARNRILFTRRYHPALVPSVLSWVMLTAVHRLLMGKPDKAAEIVAGAWDGLAHSLAASRPETRH
jgi:GT2 family glycosyltransferase